jgi:hypothetical protein
MMDRNEGFCNADYPPQHIQFLTEPLLYFRFDETTTCQDGLQQYVRFWI